MTVQSKSLEIHQKIMDSSEAINNVYKAQVEFSRVGMNDSKEFFYRVAILSGASISLSITFVSYIYSRGNISFIWVLYASWILLLVAIFSGLYRNYFHSNFIHYQLQRTMLEKRIYQEKIIQESLRDTPELVHNVYDGIDNLIQVSKERLEAYSKSAMRQSGKESFYMTLWEVAMTCAHLGFVLGIIALVLFAMLNIH